MCCPLFMNTAEEHDTAAVLVRGCQGIMSGSMWSFPPHRTAMLSPEATHSLVHTGAPTEQTADGAVLDGQRALTSLRTSSCSVCISSSLTEDGGGRATSVTFLVYQLGSNTIDTGSIPHDLSQRGSEHALHESRLSRCYRPARTRLRCALATVW